MAESDDGPGLVYSNVVQMHVGPFDLVMDFGYKAPEQAKTTNFEVVARVAMSLAHAKSMLPILAKLIAGYEQEVGPITAPGYDDKSKE